MLWFFAGCANNEPRYQPAGNALDAGREYIEACLHGDFQKASFYLSPGEYNQQQLAVTEGLYRQKDKEGRQQYRLASINLHELRELSPDSTMIFYNNSFDRTDDSLLAVRTGGSIWKVHIIQPKNAR